MVVVGDGRHPVPDELEFRLKPLDEFLVGVWKRDCVGVRVHFVVSFVLHGEDR